jgi:predicted metal-dependent phosphoesterase TrpH
MIDLHTHTNQSDGTLTPQELVAAAGEADLEALAITDHDTFAGYELALPFAERQGLELVCGIELSTKYQTRSVHLLGYFLDGRPPSEFQTWITELQATRHRRNEELVQKLQSYGIEISLEEVCKIGGKLAGRPHFASLLLAKGRVLSSQQAFDEYLGESAKCYVARDEPDLESSIDRIERSGGVTSLAHPVRLARDFEIAEKHVRIMMDAGLRAIEVYHSDHTPEDTEFYRELSERLNLLATGGSDFHGSNKPAVRLGSGIEGNVAIPRWVLDNLRTAASTAH